MEDAIAEAKKGVDNRHGGPFGTVIVRDGKIIARGHNRVLVERDPTRHGEMVAIRNACAKLHTHDLSGCELYTTGEPCPMCLCACMWANIDRIYYGCTIRDNDSIGFRDEKFDTLMGGRAKLGDYLVEFEREKCLELFDYYKSVDHENY